MCHTAQLLKLEKLIDPRTQAAAQQQNLDETKRMLDSAKAAIAGSNAVSEMANHSQPILAKLAAIEKRLADLELQIDRVEKNGCCLVM